MFLGNQAAIAVAIAALLTGGCVSHPETYAPPIQRNAAPKDGAGQWKHYVAMGDDGAPKHFIKDIHATLEGGTWRWTGQKPAVRLALPTVKSLRLVMEFSIPDAVLKQTGPLTIRYVVNGRTLDAVRYDTPGQKRFEKPVEESWLYLNGENVVSAELDKVYVAEADQAKLGVALTGIGFLD
jgi:hypothetical protein